MLKHYATSEVTNIANYCYAERCECYRNALYKDTDRKLRVLVTRFNRLTPELNPSAQRCLTSFFAGDFAF
jgi:hypothetical protein